MTAKTVFLTGATDGIGLELARLYAGRGADLHLLGRRRPEELADPLFQRAQYYWFDLSESGCERAVLAELDRRGVGSLDLVIHNAGTGYYGAIKAEPQAGIRDTLTVNLEVPLLLSHALYPKLRAANGRIVMISSVASAMACPDYAVYAASKAALDGFARSLRAEIDPRVAVTVIHPGATRTGMHAKIGLPREVVVSQRFAPAEAVAAAIIAGIDAERARVVIGTGNRILRWAGSCLGRPLDWLSRRRRSRCAS